MKKKENVVATLREHLGIIRSCALMMAHAQSAHARSGYLKTLTEKIKTMEAVMKEMEAASEAARTTATGG